MNTQSIRCECGVRLALSADVSTKRFRCPQCNREFLLENEKPTKFSAPEQKAGFFPKPAPIRDDSSHSNGMAIAGFALALLSFIAIPLAPLAMLFSFIGLRGKKHFGLAVAGSAIGSVQTIVLVIGLAVMLAIFGFAWNVTREVTQMASEMAEDARQRRLHDETVSKIETAASQIDEHTIATGKLPSEDEASEILAYANDPWGNEIRFANATTELGGYTLRSTGPDTVDGTYDDIGATFPTCAPSTSSEAMALLRGKHDRQRLAGCRWLADNAPQELSASSDDRTRIVNELISLLANSKYSQTAKSALLAWKPDDVESLGRRITERSDIDDRVRFEIFKSINYTDGFLETLNSENASIRIQSTDELASRQVDDEKLVQQSLSDLEKTNKFVYAIERLQSLPIPDSRKEEVGKKIIARVGGADIDEQAVRQSIDTAITLLEAGRTGEEAKKLIVEELSMELDSTYSENVVRRMVLVDENVAAEALASRLGAPGLRGRAIKKAIIEAGPQMETAVIIELKSSDESVRERAIEILAEIGGSKSLEALKALDDDEVEEAVEKIKERLEEQKEAKD